MADFTLRCQHARTGQSVCVVSDSGPFAPLCENIGSSTKPKVQNVLHCHQRMTKPQPQVTYRSEIWTLIIEICEQVDKEIDRHTDTLITVLCPFVGNGVKIRGRK